MNCNRLLGQFGNQLLSASHVSGVPDSEVPDKVTDTLSGIARLSQNFASELKCASPGSGRDWLVADLRVQPCRKFTFYLRYEQSMDNLRHATGSHHAIERVGMSAVLRGGRCELVAAPTIPPSTNPRDLMNSRAPRRLRCRI
jgi:hypothetical protein